MLVNTALAPPRILIFDTGPLWELVLYSVVHTLRYNRLLGELRHLQSTSSYSQLSAFVGNFPQKTTTPHVVAEISSWIKRTEEKGRPAIWGLIYTEFRAMGMDEGVLKLLEMPQELVENYGAVDTSILKLGLDLATKKPTVLSIDSELIAECKRAGLNATHLWEVIA